MTDWRIEIGDCRDVLRRMPAQSVHTVVTSPPYFGLRDYGTGEWEGGDPACDHSWAAPSRDTDEDVQRRKAKYQAEGRSTGQHGGWEGRAWRADGKSACRCGARRVDRQIGLEPTPDEFVAALVGVFREVRRVLRDDGTVWLNLGDSYAGSGPSGAAYDSATTRRRAEGNGQDGAFRVSPTLRDRGLTYRDKKPIAPPGYKPKDLLGIPWMVAFALRADGWYLRSDIIWSKPNPMPESVTDRPTKAHEYVFLLSKGPRYFYDADAIREPLREDSPVWGEAQSNRPGWSGNPNANGERGHAVPSNPAGRNKRSVWTIATQPYAGAHFATFPPKLIEPCILAGAPERACRECGAPWVRRTDVTYENPGNRTTNGPRSTERKAIEYGTAGFEVRLEKRVQTLGFEPSCSHGDGSAAGVVLDPFAGAGTTGIVALQHGRDFVGIELNPEYARMARERIEIAVRLGFRSPQTVKVLDGQGTLFDL